MQPLLPLSPQDLISQIPVQEQKLTPMMQQYIEIKAANQGSLLFYRMGDFYELFFDDAIVAAAALGITLTKRGKHLGQDIPMCGVPAHSADDYLQKLISLGHRVAVCEQLEDPKEAKKRSGKVVVRRDVVRLITPATITEEKLLEPTQANYLMALGYDRTKKNLALAWIDISTGVFRVSTTNSERLLTDVMRIEPKEVLISDSLAQTYRPLLQSLDRLSVVQPESFFDANIAIKRICSYYKLANLEGVAPFSPEELSAIGAALSYIEKTQISERPLLMLPQPEQEGARLFIDAATRTNLEILRTLSGARQGSFLKAIDRTVSSAGARLLAERVMAPLTNPNAIQERLDTISFFLQDPTLMQALHTLLKAAPDMPRALSRLSMKRGSPRDLAAISKGLSLVQEILELIDTRLLPLELSHVQQDLKTLSPALSFSLEKALAEDLPLLKREGGFIRSGYHEELDKVRRLRDESRRIIGQMQNQYAQATGIKTLKIKHNNILGYFIEITTTQAQAARDILLDKAGFIHRQTMANTMRFTTRALSDLEVQISQAAERALEIEFEIFDSLCQSLIKEADAIRQAATGLAVLDVSCGLSLLAQEEGYCRPIVDESLCFSIKGGRHPVVEQALRLKGERPFIANDCDLSPIENQIPKDEKGKSTVFHPENYGKIWLLTGPNMGGKSTFLRQNALICLLAQIGSFVPAQEAHIGIVDRLFSRVGASDDLARGRSTFMVEMIETATILNQATERSLVILDEIGRGTATYDGLSLAWACAEYLHEVNQCRAIFATHFHEMNELSSSLKRLKNVTMQVKEWDGEVIFLHQIAEGTADRSYGVQVAKLAGLPRRVVARAQHILHQLEEGKTRNCVVPIAPQDKDFSSPCAPEEEQQRAKEKAVFEALASLQPDALAPRDALAALYQLKSLQE